MQAVNALSCVGVCLAFGPNEISCLLASGHGLHSATAGRSRSSWQSSERMPVAVAGGGGEEGGEIRESATREKSVVRLTLSLQWKKDNGKKGRTERRASFLCFRVNGYRLREQHSKHELLREILIHLR